MDGAGNPVYPSDSGRAIVRGQVSMAGCMLAETGSGERLAVSLASGFESSIGCRSFLNQTQG